MKQTLFGILTLGALALTGTQLASSQVDMGEYDAVYDDGPYSLLPAIGQGAEISDLVDLDGNPEIISAEEARMTGLLLDVLAGDPIDPSL